MDSFSISQLEQFSGIKAHTIRIWEQRYNALSPNRSQGNTRNYDNSQLRRLLNIVSLMNSDYKVSELCSFSDEKLFELLQEQLKSKIIIDESSEYFISQLIATGMSYDELEFEKIFSNYNLRYGLKNTYVKLIYPMLVRIGLMWTNNSLHASHEHFISNLIRQKLFSAIDSLPLAKSSEDSWLLFLPENEFHEIGLLFSNYLIRFSGKKVFYIGGNVPLDTLSHAIKENTPSNVLFFVVNNNAPEDLKKFINKLKNTSINTKIHISGNEKLISQLKTGKQISWINSVEDLEAKL